jgi:hypothetical protein
MPDLSSITAPAASSLGLSTVASAVNPYLTAYMGLRVIGSGVRNIKGKGRLLDAIFGRGAEEEFDDRKRKFLAELGVLREKTIREGGAEILKNTEAEAASVRSSAARRAMSLGRSADAEAFMLPGQSQAYERGSRAGSAFVRDVSQRFDAAALGVEAGRMDLPQTGGLIDAAMPVAEYAVENSLNMDFLDKLNGMINGRESVGARGGEATTTARARSPLFSITQPTVQSLDLDPSSTFNPIPMNPMGQEGLFPGGVPMSPGLLREPFTPAKTTPAKTKSRRRMFVPKVGMIDM